VSAEGGRASTLRAAAPLILAGFAISFVLIGGGIDTVGVFVNAIVRSTDWGRSLLSLGVSVGALSAAAATPLVGLGVDRFGVRGPMLVGVALLAVGFAILVRMQEPWHFVGANVLLGAGFAACALLPLTVAITVSVPRHTALALGIAGTGASVGALLLAPTVQALIEALGWRGAYLAMGAAVVLTPLPFLAFVLPRGRLRRDASVVEAAAAPATIHGLPEPSRSAMLPLGALMMLPGLVTLAVSIHLVPYLTDAGHSGRAAATALGATIGISAVGKIFGGALADRKGELFTLRVALALGAASFALLPAAATLPVLAGFVVLYGLALGTHVAVMPPLARNLLGVERFGARFGTLQLAGMLAAAVGAVAAGMLFDAMGRYTVAIGLWSSALLCALLVAVRMRVPEGHGSAGLPVDAR
jgi:MFS family permease